MNISDFSKMKRANLPIKMITCYDYWTAKILSATEIDCILVGDSAAQVMHGASSTIPADCQMMEMHTKAVRQGAGNKFIIGDMPFLSYRKSLTETMHVVEKLMKAGANAIKLEGVTGNEDLIRHIVASGVPVMGHIGFTPQSINMFGKNIVQGKETAQAKLLLEDAQLLENLGCFALVLECMPADLGIEITNTLAIPTIGIGAGAGTSGQVLVLQDLLGADDAFTPKFLKRYLNINSLIKDAVNQYCHEVDNNIFPSAEHTYANHQ